LSETPGGHGLPVHGRFEYAPIGGRAPYRWPGGARLAVYFALGVEYYAFGEGLSDQLVPSVAKPDVLNWSWQEYGNRVGAWRLLDAFAEDDLPLAILLNTAIYDHAPALTDAFRRASHEIVAHGHSNSDTLGGMDEAVEARYLADVTARIAAHERTPPQGWASPWIAETARTPDLLARLGYRYVLDWCMDDQPVWLKTAHGPLLAVPYSQELNDSSTMIGRQFSAGDFADMIVDQFDEMMRSGRDEPLVMSVILHAFIAGQPFRMRALRRAIRHIVQRRADIWLTQPGQICAHVAQLEPPPSP
jgi:peptidoglycan/xylan/chitin deacetylase (PgdA/CDA1 family)